MPTGPGPSLFHTDGGVWIASLGYGSDEPIEELDGLLQELQPQLRVPRLCRLLRTVVDQGSPAARRTLDEELLRHDQLLQLLMKPDGRSTFTAMFPGVGPVLRGYPDLISLKLTAHTPTYVVWTPEEVRLMAAGKLPLRGIEA